MSASVLAQRVGWCADLVSAMTTELLKAHFNAADVNTLAAGVDAAGRRLPSNAWMAPRRLGWSIAPPQGVRVNDRIMRMAQEMAGRILRSAQWRADLTTGVLAVWPADPAKRTPAEWGQVRARVSGGKHLPSTIIGSRTRQITAFAHKHGRMPVDVFDLEGVPRAARMLVLSACDAQQATLERHESDPGRILLRLKLPTRPDPRTYADWTWVACPLALPPTVPPSAVLHLPALRPRDGKVRADVAYSHAVPQARRSGHTVALGVDWGLNTLLSAGAVRLHGDGHITALGSGAMFRAGGVLAKQHRLRRQGEFLHAKTDHHQRLTTGDAAHPLHTKHAVLAAEARRVSAKRSRLNDALAASAARWAVDQAVAAGATVIYVEDLRSIEARGMGRTMNTRLSQQVRGRVVGRMHHAAAEVGIAVVTVPARGTSKHCPRCLAPLGHRKTPDRLTRGWKWALCPDSGCGRQGDRDTGAWQRVAARGLTHQTRTVTDHATGAMGIRTVVDTLETRAVTAPATTRTRQRDRSKTGPTRRRLTRPAPRRRRAPSPTRPHGRAGQRPEGHAPPDRSRLPRAAHRHQGVNTISTPTIRHRPRGAALGAGFHLHAHATPPRGQIPLPDTTSYLGLPS
ncbi:transposase [Nocardiopsis alborubida]|uniref:transposase n=1 Tax=Nocardiopsis alborubida TaxID=146802 RepID=UPI001E5BE7B9|nr:transposase [Nocardiopsis alborubida]